MTYTFTPRKPPKIIRELKEKEEKELEERFPALKSLRDQYEMMKVLCKQQQK